MSISSPVIFLIFVFLNNIKVLAISFLQYASWVRLAYVDVTLH